MKWKKKRLSTPLTLQEKKERLSPKIGSPAQKQSLWCVPPCRSKEQTYSDNSAERRPLEGTTTEQVEKEQAEGTEQSEQPKKQQQKKPLLSLAKEEISSPSPS